MTRKALKIIIAALILGIPCQNMQAAKKTAKKEKTSKKETNMEDKVRQEHKKAASLHKELAKDPVLKNEARDHEELANAHSKLAKGAQGEEKKKALATIQEYRAKLGLELE